MVSVKQRQIYPCCSFTVGRLTCWIGVSLSLGFRQSVAPSCLASSNLDGLVSITKIREAFLAFAACHEIFDARR